MGVFDDVRCLYPLVFPEVQDEIFQSKDTPAQVLDYYELRVDGTLWHKTYDTRIEVADDAPYGFWWYQDNPRWEQEILDGEIEIHTNLGDGPDMIWYSFRFWFRNGVVQDVISKRDKTNE